MKGLLHHGLCSGEFEPRYIGTDYFSFFHTPCQQNEPFHGHCEVIAVLIDNDGRIVFNLKCRSCGIVDALKTHPLMWLENKQLNALTRFYLSPELKTRIKRHRWDNL